MKKEEITLIIKALVPALAKMIKTEVRKVVKPMIKEAVEAQVNKILAEHFLTSLNSRNLLTEMSPEPRPQRREIKEERASTQRSTRSKEELMRKLGISDNPVMLEAFSDIDDEDMHGTTGFGEYQDPLEADDDGVDVAALLGTDKPFARW